MGILDYFRTEKKKTASKAKDRLQCGHLGGHLRHRERSASG